MVKKFRLTLDIDVEMDGTEPVEILQRLRELADFGMDRGLLTGDLPAYVVEYEVVAEEFKEIKAEDI